MKQFSKISISVLAAFVVVGCSNDDKTPGVKTNPNAGPVTNPSTPLGAQQPQIVNKGNPAAPTTPQAVVADSAEKIAADIMATMDNGKLTDKTGEYLKGVSEASKQNVPEALVLIQSHEVSTLFYGNTTEGRAREIQDLQKLYQVVNTKKSEASSKLTELQTQADATKAKLETAKAPAAQTTGAEGNKPAAAPEVVPQVDEAKSENLNEIVGPTVTTKAEGDAAREVVEEKAEQKAEVEAQVAAQNKLIADLTAQIEAEAKVIAEVNAKIDELSAQNNFILERLATIGQLARFFYGYIIVPKPIEDATKDGEIPQVVPAPSVGMGDVKKAEGEKETAKETSEGAEGNAPVGKKVIGSFRGMPIFAPETPATPVSEQAAPATETVPASDPTKAGSSLEDHADEMDANDGSEQEAPASGDHQSDDAYPSSTSSPTDGALPGPQ